MAKKPRNYSREADQIQLFLGTLYGQTLEEALVNLEADARSYGWSRLGVREAASEIRRRFSR